MTYNGKETVRVGQTEKDFRLFEPLIVRALTEVAFEVDAKNVGRGMADRTFVNRFTDAKSGWEKHGWKSEQIRHGYPVKEIKAKMLSGGGVVIVNQMMERYKWSAKDAAEFAMMGMKPVVKSGSETLKWEPDESILLLDREKLDAEGKQIYDFILKDKEREEEKKRVKGERA